MDNKELERPRNQGQETKWGETVGNTQCMWTGMLQYGPDMRQEPAGSHYSSPYVVGLSLPGSRDSRVQSTHSGGEVAFVHVGMAILKCSPVA